MGEMGTHGVATISARLDAARRFAELAVSYEPDTAEHAAYDTAATFLPRAVSRTLATLAAEHVTFLSNPANCTQWDVAWWAERAEGSALAWQTVLNLANEWKV